VSFDLQLFNFAHGITDLSPILDWVVVFFAQYLPYVAALIAFIIIVREKVWKKKIWAFLVLTFSFVFSKGFVVEAIHYFYDRPRPFLALGLNPLFPELSNAFPSSHAVILTTIALVIYLLNRKAGVWFFIFAIVNGITRVVAGVHWPTDIVGGIILAFFGVFLALKLFPEREYISSPHQEEKVEESIAHE
jgi:undecaprenyl-diphosphatase